MKWFFCLICFSNIGSFVYSTDLEQLEFHSQASQDKFVYTLLYDLLDKQDPGYYLEIGASYPKLINNTYFFEKNLDWNGVSIDISPAYVHLWFAARDNLLRIEDATRSDYTAILQDFPRVVDYLSLDIDCYYDTVLRRIPFHKHIFRVITIEHDFYSYGDTYRLKERRILKELGYYLLCPDVLNEGNSFEDWWIYPSEFPPEVLSALKTLDLKSKDHQELIEAIQTVQ